MGYGQILEILHLLVGLHVLGENVHWNFLIKTVIAILNRNPGLLCLFVWLHNLVQIL